ncbi:uncharacterized protein RCO7_01296 [Rhynchosporium graminicola]|uniref:AA9 family lytic polysaccharide monooxygenase n=1 Tax=Rhynchosporium graminicola TaxID=2792576 RepID=A0A1E1K4J2_9HELO|nr:uncharacterized protein RCO7_01296 [Rhynchosporium commune]
MKSFTTVLVVLCLLQQASAHYIFWQLTYEGTKYPSYTYVRKNNNYNSPVTVLTSNDLRCNDGGASGASTETLPVKAGSEFTFTADIAVYHQGATSIYMAKAPGTAKEYDGSGQNWFKIYELGPKFTGSGEPSWPLYTTYTYRIPPATPNGEYLLRIEQLAIHNPGSTPQFYVSCAQVSVSGGGNGQPGPLVSIPGYVKGTESGYTANIYNNFKSYMIVGPQVWAAQNDTSAPAETTSITAIPIVTTKSLTPVGLPTTLVTTPVGTISSTKVCHFGTTSSTTTTTSSTKVCHFGTSSSLNPITIPTTASSTSQTTSIPSPVFSLSPITTRTSNPSGPLTIYVTLPPTIVTITAPASGDGKTVTVTTISIFTVTTYDTVTVTATINGGNTASTNTPPTETGNDGGGGAGTIAMYMRCGGKDFTGTGTCAAGSTCRFNSEYYSQCVAG